MLHACSPQPLVVLLPQCRAFAPVPGGQPPSIVRQPQSLICVSGDITTFSVEVSGASTEEVSLKRSADVVARVAFVQGWKFEPVISKALNNDNAGRL